MSNFPSDVECQKSLTIPYQDSTDEDLLAARAKCLEMILKAIVMNIYFDLWPLLN